jgi:hypothetical protein
MPKLESIWGEVVFLEGMLDGLESQTFHLKKRIEHLYQFLDEEELLLLKKRKEGNEIL